MSGLVLELSSRHPGPLELGRLRPFPGSVQGLSSGKELVSRVPGLVVFALPGDAGFTRFRSGRTGGGRGRGLRGAAVLGATNDRA